MPATRGGCLSLSARDLHAPVKAHAQEVAERVALRGGTILEYPTDRGQSSAVQSAYPLRIVHSVPLRFPSAVPRSRKQSSCRSRV